MKDKTIKCRECGQEFVWTGIEQATYQQRGWGEPNWCLICRAKKQAETRDWQKYGKKTNDK